MSSEVMHSSDLNGELSNDLNINSNRSCLLLNTGTAKSKSGMEGKSSYMRNGFNWLQWRELPRSSVRVTHVSSAFSGLDS